MPVEITKTVHGQHSRKCGKLKHLTTFEANQSLNEHLRCRHTAHNIQKRADVNHAKYFMALDQRKISQAHVGYSIPVAIVSKIDALSISLTRIHVPLYSA